MDIYKNSYGDTYNGVIKGHHTADHVGGMIWLINTGTIINTNGLNKIDQALVNKYNQDSYGSEKGFLAFFNYHVPNGHTTWYLTVPSFIGSGTGAYLYLDIYKNSTGNEYSGVIRGHCQNDNKELLTWFVSTGRIQRAD